MYLYKKNWNAEVTANNWINKVALLDDFLLVDERNEMSWDDINQLKKAGMKLEVLDFNNPEISDKWNMLSRLYDADGTINQKKLQVLANDSQNVRSEDWKQGQTFLLADILFAMKKVGEPISLEAILYFCDNKLMDDDVQLPNFADKADKVLKARLSELEARLSSIIANYVDVLSDEEICPSPEAKQQTVKIIVKFSNTTTNEQKEDFLKLINTFAFEENLEITEIVEKQIIHPALKGFLQFLFVLVLFPASIKLTSGINNYYLLENSYLGVLVFGAIEFCMFKLKFKADKGMKALKYYLFGAMSLIVLWIILSTASLSWGTLILLFLLIFVFFISGVISFYIGLSDLKKKKNENTAALIMTYVNLFYGVLGGCVGGWLFVNFLGSIG